MSKAALTPIVKLSELDDAARERLGEYAITTVEELYGQLEAQPEQVASLLTLDQNQIMRLKAEAEELIDDETLAAMAAQKSQRYTYGAALD